MSIKDNTLSLQSILDTVNNLPTVNNPDVPDVPDEPGVHYFYKSGNTYDSITGGWSGDNLQWGGKTSSIVPITLDSEKIIASGSWSSIAVGATKNNVDLSGINTLYLRYQYTGENSSDTKFGVTLSDEIKSGSSNFNSPAYKQLSSKDNVVSLDVSTVNSGRIYVSVYIADVYIYEIWGE